MASNPPSQCCASGFQHDGKTTGSYEDIGSYECYVSRPANNDTKRAILLLTDVMGHKFTNAQLIADRFAANNYFTVVPDLFHGDAIPLDAPEDMSIMSWLHGSDENPGHLPPRVDPVVSSVINALRSSYGVEKLGGVGYCFGAKYVIRFLQDNTSERLDAGFVAHPSFVTAEELKAISGSLSIAAAANDPVFSVAKRRETEDILMDHSNKDIPWQISLYNGVDHGFAVRCDVKDQKQKFAMEQAFLQGTAWFNEFL